MTGARLVSTTRSHVAPAAGTHLLWKNGLRGPAVPLEPTASGVRVPFHPCRDRQGVVAVSISAPAIGEASLFSRIPTAQERFCKGATVQVCEEFEDRLIDYAELAGRDRAEVDVHLAACPACRDYFEILNELDSKLVRQYSGVESSLRMEEQVRRAIASPRARLTICLRYSTLPAGRR